MPELPIEEAQARLPELIERTITEGARTVITRDGEPVAVLISIPTMRLFEELQEHDDAVALQEMAREREEIGVPLAQARETLRQAREARRCSG
jgi:prevent-host-death family protein